MVEFDEILEGEPLQVACWRFGELLRMGFSLDDAERLAIGTVDVRDLENMIDAGCPPELAAEIRG